MKTELILHSILQEGCMFRLQGKFIWLDIYIITMRGPMPNLMEGIPGFGLYSLQKKGILENTLFQYTVHIVCLFLGKRAVNTCVLRVPSGMQSS